MGDLQGGGHFNLPTKHGPLVLLSDIGPGLRYDQLIPLSTEMDIGAGVHVRVLNLETIIAVKERLGSEKDLPVLPVPRQTLRELEQRG